MPSEYALNLCFIREHTESLFLTAIDKELYRLFAGKGTWYIDEREESGLDIAVAEVKGLAAWASEDEVILYIEENMLPVSIPDSECWEHLQGYQVKVSPKADAGCCRLKK
ncbi:hypothetical protein ACFQZT_29325 [Paenibacillus sp. GCM10027628]|uniref:hypothetical protein n=1 Tax=Paenibacillus sp. GCM10027628 TaxID=3273413 RepID=UPI0036349F2F